MATLLKFIWDDLVWVLPAFLLVICYLTGDLVQMLFQVHKGICLKVLSGFVILLCLFHLTSLPFMYNDWPFTTLYTLFLCDLIGIIIAYSVISIVKRRIPLQDDLDGLRTAFRDIIKKRWWHLILWASALFLIIWHISMVILHVGHNVDDNFYISESVTILSRNRLMNVLPACGIEGSVFPATYILVSWETLIAAISKLFLVSPAVLCHSIIPAFLLPLHYMAYYAAAREFSRRKTALFLIFVLLLNFACGPSTYNQGAFLTLRIWQGKAVLVNILLPLLLYEFLRITKAKKLSLNNIFFLFSLLLASQAATTVGTYLAPVLYAVYAITFLIIHRKIKEFLKLLIPAAGITPFVLWKLWILLSAGTLGDLSEGTGVYDRSFRELLMRYFGFSLVVLFFIIAIIILAVRIRKGPQKSLRFFFLIATLLMIVFLINPLVMPFAERFITGSGVYWRVFWLLQITFVTALGLCYICEIPKKKLLQTAILLFLSIAILISGRSIFKDEDVKEKFKNHSKVSETTRRIVYTVRSEVERDNPDASDEEQAVIEQETILLLPKSLARELRQYADISLIYYPYYSNNYYAYQTDAEFEQLQYIYDLLYRKKSWNSKYLYNAVTTLGIDYVAIGSDTAEENAADIPFWFEAVYRGKRYTLYKTNGGH